jgi:C-terminal processing protease CtpA/Prc
MFNYQNPTRAEREQIIKAATSLFKQRFYEPKLNGFDLDGELQNQMGSLLETSHFPAAMKDFFRGCGARPIDFFHETERRVSLEKLLKATFFKDGYGEHAFQDVLIGGRAEEAGIDSGDVLASVNDQPPRESLDVLASQPFRFSVRRLDGSTKAFDFPAPATWRPRNEKNVAFRDLGDGVGYVRIAMWPGILGMDVARETDEAIKKLKAKRLLVDLRGNLGSAGAGNLRLMSYLTPKKIPVGYSLTRRRAEAGYDRDDLARLERIPRSKLEAPFVLWRFRKVDKSIVVVTEGLKPQAFQGNVTLLVNSHTFSGAEIVVQFAKEHGLARIVGERTAGRSLSFATLQVPCDFRLTLPIGDYVPWHGERFEVSGVEPDVQIPFRLPKNAGDDLQLSDAVKFYDSCAAGG